MTAAEKENVSKMLDGVCMGGISCAAMCYKCLLSLGDFKENAAMCVMWCCDTYCNRLNPIY